MPRIDSHKPGTFCWIELSTTDQQAARKFYGALFGWSVQEMPMGPGDVYDFYQLQGLTAAAGCKLRPEQISQGVPPHWMLYITVEDADATAKRAAELGAKVIAPPFDVFSSGRMAVIQDPTGAMFSIWQPKDNQGTSISGEPGTMCWADLATRDVPAAKSFYEGLFGWRVSASPNDTSGYLHIQNGEDYVAGMPPAEFLDPHAPPHWMTYFHVADCFASVARAKELGARVYIDAQTMEKVGTMAVLADPQGAVFALFTPLK